MGSVDALTHSYHQKAAALGLDGTRNVGRNYLLVNHHLTNRRGTIQRKRRKGMWVKLTIGTCIFNPSWSSIDRTSAAKWADGVERAYIVHSVARPWTERGCISNGC